MNTRKVLQAIYRETGVSSFEGNPLIEALPPIMTREEMCSRIEWLPPTPNEEQRKKTVEQRHHELPSIRRIVYVLPEYALYGSIISVILRDGYTTRNPQKVETWQQLYYTNAEAKGAICSPEPVSHQASGIVFSGLSGMGKSTLFKRYLQLLPQVLQHTSYKGNEFVHLQLVWIKIDCPYNGSLSGLVQSFFEAVDSALGTKYAKEYFPKGGKSPTLSVLLGEMSRIAANYFLGVLIIDELQNLSRAKTHGDEGFLSFLSSLVEHIGVPVIGIGTPAVTKVFRKRLEDARRATAMGFYDFQRLSEDEDAWTDLLDTVLRYSWLDQPIQITSELRASFYFHTQGITAIVIALFVLAQYRCIGEEDAVFDPALLDDISKRELASLQSALRVLRSGSKEALADFDDLAEDKLWADAARNLDEILAKAARGRPTKSSKQPDSKPKAPDVKKGTSPASNDNKDIRNVATATDAHDELVRKGVTPTNIFSMEPNPEPSTS